MPGSHIFWIMESGLLLFVLWLFPCSCVRARSYRPNTQSLGWLLLREVFVSLKQDSSISTTPTNLTKVETKCSDIRSSKSSSTILVFSLEMLSQRRAVFSFWPRSQTSMNIRIFSRTRWNFSHILASNTSYFPPHWQMYLMTSDFNWVRWTGLPQ